MAYEEYRTPLRNPLSPIRLEYYQLKLSRGGEEVTRQAHNLEIDSSILSPATSYR